MAASSKATFFTYPKVVCLGDSITQLGFSPNGQWVALLADFLIRRCDVMNRGFGGYTSRTLRPLLPVLVQAGDYVTLLIIFCGTNDAVLATAAPTVHVPLDEYEANLRAMIDYAGSVGIPPGRIIMITPPPVDEQRVKFCALAVTRMYAERCSEVAISYNIDYIPIFDIIIQDDPEHWQRHLIDGVHFSASGSLLLFNALKPIVADKFASIAMMAPHDEVEPSCFPSVVSIIRDLIHLNVDYWRRRRSRRTCRMATKHAKP